MRTMNRRLCLCYGEVNPEGHVLTDSAQYLPTGSVNSPAARSWWKSILPTAGDDSRCYQSMEMGALDLYLGQQHVPGGQRNPMMSALVLPYVFRDWEHPGRFAAVIRQWKYWIISRTVPE